MVDPGRDEKTDKPPKELRNFAWFMSTPGPFSGRAFPVISGSERKLQFYDKSGSKKSSTCMSTFTSPGRRLSTYLSGLVFVGQSTIYYEHKSRGVICRHKGGDCIAARQKFMPGTDLNLGPCYDREAWKG